MRALRIDPEVPLLWRSPTSLQLGLGRVAARLDRIDLADERMLHALTVGVSRSALTVIAEEAGRPGADAALLRRLRGVLLPDARTGAPAIAVHGVGPTARAVARVLEADGAASPVLAVLVADWVVTPADAGAWLRRDVPHLAVVLADGIATIGPHVVPGVTPCLHCAHLGRVAADPAWPMLATQLLDRPTPTLDPLARSMVAVAVGRAARAVLDSALPAGEVRELDWRTGRVRRHTVAAHPDCACGAHADGAIAR